MDLRYIGSNQRAAIKLMVELGEITVRDLQYNTDKDKRDCKKALDRLVNRGLATVEIKKGFIRTKKQRIKTNRLVSHYSLTYPDEFRFITFF